MHSQTPHKFHFICNSRAYEHRIFTSDPWSKNAISEHLDCQAEMVCFDFLSSSAEGQYHLLTDNYNYSSNLSCNQS